MPGGDKKIHEHPNANSNGFAQRPHEAGRKKKNYTEHIEDIKKKGYTAPTKSQYFEMVGLLLSMEEDDLKDFAKDKSRPYWIRLIVVDLNSKQTRQRMMSDYRDWLFGKATQYSENLSNHTIENFNIKDIITFKENVSDK